jgi:GT2 family glycosyltransferase
VVDNASIDGSAEMVAEKFPQVKLIINSKNLGFAKANNIAIRQAQSNFILLLNPDMLVFPELFIML